MIDWLNSTALTVFGAPTTWAEVLGFATGLITCGCWCGSTS
jgi:nicotinamide mononucleotide transporter